MRVRVSEPCFIDNRYYPADSEFEYAGELAHYMTPVDGKAQEREQTAAPAPVVPFKRGPGRPRKDAPKPTVTYAEVQKGASPQA